MILFACDCGLANFGWAVLSVESWGLQCLGAGVICTEKSALKRGVLVADDTTRRVRELTHELVVLLDRYQPLVLCSESMSWPRNAGNAAKLGMARAVLDCLAEVRGLPVIQASPQEVKKTVCGNRAASKEDIIAAVSARCSLALPEQKTLREHAADAVAVGLTCLSSDVVRALRGAAA